MLIDVSCNTLVNRNKTEFIVKEMLLHLLSIFALESHGREGTDGHNALNIPIGDPFSRNPARQQTNVARVITSPGFSFGEYDYGI